ncbi:MAG: YitT family protein [Lachnospiraceae bacterium]|nr:YitT family protein [Lachnospiraceae bacterium]
MKTNSMLSILEMLAGTILTAAAFDLIIIPQGFAAGGVTGFSKIISQLSGVGLSAIVLSINLSLLAVGLLFIGKAFVAKTIFLSILFPVLLEMMSSFSITSLNGNPILGILIAALLLGNGAGLILRSGASQGGFDVIAVILNKKCKISVATVMNIFDCSVILMQAIGQPPVKTIYGIIVIVISSRIVNYLLTAEEVPGKSAVRTSRPAECEA